ncbi:hypothetical protein EIN_409710 [Entamoeba invadens IP1]|uniref:Sulfotransferase n=1 Tax=Entamoeba invadens IP1 TaxID=370355 RepID=A0A0A1TWS0_ENTIV|nr:hypothetical protein EIN_409710 [Entamoeba invadens IP1]ELP85652.1 hypothetical protein EIN_409710 [Entamoeba invadens IP1]|eukprot:XP_004184998.1 hypothetical protein EIN_409710 [Entamoeba invadens IP1]
MSSLDTTLKDFVYPYKYEVDKTSKYICKEMPEAPFEQIWEKLKGAAVMTLSKYDPSHMDEYKKMLLKGDSLFNPQFKQIVRDFFAGCFDQGSPMFQTIFRNMVGKVMCYMRFSTEQTLYREELDKVKLDRPLFITSMPRSGSTFLHNLIANDPRANAIHFFEHVSPGSHTMDHDARVKVLQDMLNAFHDNSTIDMNTVHNMDSPMNYEEELFFMELLGQCFVMSSSLPRLEQYREHIFNIDYHYVYEALIDEIKMHIVEYPMQRSDGFMCLKAVCHFASMAPMLDVLGDEKYNANFVWIHREPLEQIKSLIPLLLGAQGRFEHDLGRNDIEWINKYVLKINEIILRNIIATRDEWIKKDPKRADRIIDVGFVDLVSHPKETVEKIYKKFGIDYTEEVDKILDITINEKDPQRKHGRKQHDQNLYLFKDDDVREQFKFYYERFGAYLPKYYEQK